MKGGTEPDFPRPPLTQRAAPLSSKPVTTVCAPVCADKGTHLGRASRGRCRYLCVLSLGRMKDSSAPALLSMVALGTY